MAHIAASGMIKKYRDDTIEGLKARHNIKKVPYIETPNVSTVEELTEIDPWSLEQLNTNTSLRFRSDRYPFSN